MMTSRDKKEDKIKNVNSNWNANTFDTNLYYYKINLYGNILLHTSKVQLYNFTNSLFRY